VSKRSIVNVTSPMPTMFGPPMMIGVVYYASQNGLCSCDSNGNIKNVFDGLMNREDWQALNPTSINGFVYNGKYFGFYNTGTVQGGFCFDPKGDKAALTLFPFYATGGFMDIVQDHLLLQVGTDIYLWNAAGTSMTATWRSGVIETMPKTFAFARVLASDYTKTITFNLYGDGVLVDTTTVTSADPFRVEGDDKHIQWEVEVICNGGQVYRVILADSAADMRQAGGA
jgi:hypothetical protein